MVEINEYYVERWLEHVRLLAVEIGPRGSTREGERKGANYCRRVMSDLDLNPVVDSFSSARSIYHPHLLAALGMLLAFALYPVAGRASAVVAALLSLMAFSSQVLELSLRDNLLRRLIPKGKSQNVISRVEPAAEHQQDIVVIGHVDSHRTPIIFSSEAWVKLYQAFTTVAFLLALLQTVLFSLGVFTQWSWIWSATIPGALSALLVALLCLHADRTPFSPGANDNATGAGLVLTLAEQLQREPLQHGRVWLACTGCEEVQHYGAADFFARHGRDLKRPVTVVLESLGCLGPAWLTREGIVLPFRAHPALVRLAERMAQEHPELGAYDTTITGGNTEMADSLLVGIPAITIAGVGPQGELPYWHQKEDTFDKMNPEVMSRAYAFTWRYLQALDRAFPAA